MRRGYRFTIITNLYPRAIPSCPLIPRRVRAYPSRTSYQLLISMFTALRDSNIVLKKKKKCYRFNIQTPSGVTHHTEFSRKISTFRARA